MGSVLYLLSLSVDGIRSIDQPIEFRFYKKTIANDFDPSHYRVKAIFGENGSGKTAVILAIKILKSILLDDSYLFDMENQQLLVETVNKHKKNGSIECEFIFGERGRWFIGNYHVDFSTRDGRRFLITAERFLIKNGNYSKNVFATVFETRNGELISFGKRSNLEEFQRLTQNLLEQRGFLTWLLDERFLKMYTTEQEHADYSLFVLFFFALRLNAYIDDEDNHINYLILRRIEEFEEEESTDQRRAYIEQAIEQFRNSHFDTRIVAKKYYARFEAYVSRMCSFLKIFKPDLRRIEIEKKEAQENYTCELIMVYEFYRIDKELESKGIKRLIRLFSYLDAASRGMIVFIDELDSSISDVYFIKLIEYFMYYGEGQLCFTSHNLSPMNVLNDNKYSINFISSTHIVHAWTRKGNESPEDAYRRGFIEGSPFNVDATDFIGILGGADETTASNMRGDE